MSVIGEELTRITRHVDGAIEGLRYNAGDKIGYLKAVIDFALERDDLRQELVEFIIKNDSRRKTVPWYDF